MVEFLQVYLPICIYILLIILLIICIILGVKLIGTANKVDEIVKNIESKINSFNGFFSLLDFTTDKITSITNRVVDGVTTLVSKIGKKRYSDEMEDDDYE